MALNQDQELQSSLHLPQIKVDPSKEKARSSKQTEWDVPECVHELRRKMDYSISYNGKPHDEDIAEISKEILHAINLILQPCDQKNDWIQLNNLIEVCIQYKDFFYDASFYQYIEKLVYRYHVRKKNLMDVPVLKNLRKIFPQSTASAEAKYDNNMSLEVRKNKFPKKSLQKLNTSYSVTASKMLPDGKNPYKLIRLEDEPITYIGEEPLTFEKLQNSFGNVAIDTMAVDTFNKPQINSTTTKAMSVQLPQSDTSQKIPNIENFDNVTKSFWDLSPKRPNKIHETKNKAVNNKKEGSLLNITGLEAVEIFLKHRHLQKTRFVYLNYAQNRHYRPYDLISVKREDADSEHFVFSCFGVMHVSDKTKEHESITLAEWFRCASLWNIVHRIPFFSEFLIRRVLTRWRSNARSSAFNRYQSQLSEKLLFTIPIFRLASTHIFRLINELSQVTFLPARSHMKDSYHLFYLKRDVLSSQIVSQKHVFAFFRCCNKVFETTRQSCFNQLHHYKQQVTEDRPLKNNESLYLQRKKREARMNNLKEAQKTCKHLNRFLAMAEQAIHCHLVAIARKEIMSFVYGFVSRSKQFLSKNNQNQFVNVITNSKISTSEPERSFQNNYEDSNFVAEVRFNENTHLLEVIPSVEEFVEQIKTSTNNLFNIFCDHTTNTDTSVSKVKKEQVAEVVEESSSSSSAHSFDVSDVERNQPEDNPSLSVNEDKDTSGHELFYDSFPTQVPLQDIVTKSKDDLGMLTPDIVKMTAPMGLVVEGQEIMTEFRSIDREKFWLQLTTDPDISTAITNCDTILETTQQEATNYCKDLNSWLQEVRKLTKKWSKQKLKEIRQNSTPGVKNLLSKLKLWIEKVKDLNPHAVCGKNILRLNHPQLYDLLCPALKKINEEVIEMVLFDTTKLTNETTQEMINVIKLLSNKQTEMKLFADYAAQVQTSFKRKVELKSKCLNIKENWNIIVDFYRPLTQLEQQEVDQMDEAWETYLKKLEEGDEFIALQKPIVLDQLDEKVEKLTKKACEIIEEGIQGIPLDPESDSKKVISKLLDCMNKVRKVNESFEELDDFKRTIYGESCNFQQVKKAVNDLNQRLSLWQSISSSEAIIETWKGMSVKKFNPHAAIEKVFGWQKIVEDLSQYLPVEDAVLVNWCERIENLLLDLPSLCQIASEAIRFRHWEEIFVALDTKLDAESDLIVVDDLLKCNLFEHSKAINNIYCRAWAEYTLEQKLNNVKKFWEERQFHLAKYIYIVKTISYELPSKLPNDERIIEKEVDSGTYVMVELENLFNDLTECQVSLHLLLHSKHGVEIRPKAKIWNDTLHQLSEIFNLWLFCQNNWAYLNRVFNGEPQLTSSHLNDLRDQFLEADKLYRDFMQTISKDPKVLSVLSRLYGQKGWRELQGEPLRKHLQKCVQIQEKILSEISFILDEFRSSFPRLFYLSDDSCIRLLGVSRQPSELVPYIRECFNGVTSVHYQIPKDYSQNITDIDLYSDKLIATHLIGSYHESLPIKPVEAGDSLVCLNQIEENMRESIYKLLQEAITERLLNLNQEEISEVFDDFTNLIKEDLDTHQFNHWLLRYPSQVLLLCNDIVLFRRLADIIDHGQPKYDYYALVKEIGQNIQSYSSLYNECSEKHETLIMESRLSAITSQLIVQACHHRDIVNKLMSSNCSSKTSYEWQTIIKPSIRIKNFLPLKLRMPENSSLFDESISKKIEVEECYIEHMGENDRYGYEFQTLLQGKSSKSSYSATVITPSVEKCMFGTIVALRAGICGGVSGCSGIGKTTVVKELSRLYGRILIDFNCTKDSVTSVINKCLIGAVETGAWVCFDHAELLPPQTLSILSQKIQEVLRSVSMAAAKPSTAHCTRGVCYKNPLKKTSSILSLRPDKMTPYDSKLYDAKESVHVKSFDDEWLSKKGLHQSDCHKKKDKEYFPSLLGNIFFNGDLIPVRNGFGFLFNFTTTDGFLSKLPENMKMMFRSTTLIQPDLDKLAEVWLLASGFVDAARLAKKLVFAFRILLANSAQIENFDLNRNPNKEFATIREIIRVASLMIPNAKRNDALRTRKNEMFSRPLLSRRLSLSSIHSSSSSDVASSVSRASSRRSELILLSQLEEQVIADAILVSFTPKFGFGNPVVKITEILRSVFSVNPSAEFTRNHQTNLQDAIRSQMQADGLYPSPKWIEKASELFFLLQNSQSVILTGTAGSGKTSLYRTLAKAFNSLSLDVLTKRALNTQEHQNKDVVNFVNSLSKITSTHNIKEKDNLIEKLQNTRQVTKLTLKAIYDRFNIKEIPTGLTDLGTQPNYCQELNVNISVIFPNSHTLNDLYGYYPENNKNWKEGVLSRYLKFADSDTKKVYPTQRYFKNNLNPDSHLCPKYTLHRWLVLDGDLCHRWIDGIISSFHGMTSKKLNNLSRLDFPSKSNIIFETGCLTSASPAIISQCAVLLMDVPHLWRIKADAWLDSAYSKYRIAKHTTQIWREVFYELIPPTIDFLSTLSSVVSKSPLTQNVSTQSCHGVHEITSFLDLFHACLETFDLNRYNGAAIDDTSNAINQKDYLKAGSDRSNLKMSKKISFVSISVMADKQIPFKTHTITIHLLLFSLVWSFGGSLSSYNQLKFDNFLRKEIDGLRGIRERFPNEETIFDYFFDKDQLKFLTWDCKNALIRDSNSTYTNLVANERYFHLSSLLLNFQKSVMIFGETGCGKSSFVDNKLLESFELNKIQMSPGLRPSQMQQIIEKKASPTFQQHNLGLMAHPNTILAETGADKKLSLFFLDDLSFTGKLDETNYEVYQPNLEILRQLISTNEVYDEERLIYKSLESDLVFLATVTSPGKTGSGFYQSRHPVPSRLLRHFFLLNMIEPTRDMLVRIYYEQIHSWIEEFPVNSLRRSFELGQILIEATHELYERVSDIFKPAPRKPHYIFSLHDIGKVLKGIFMMIPSLDSRPVIRIQKKRMMKRNNRRNSAKKRSIKAVTSDNTGILPMMRTVTRLWIHECCRVFSDRFTDKADQVIFNKTICEVLESQFCSDKESKIYEPVKKVPLSMPLVSHGQSVDEDEEIKVGEVEIESDELESDEDESDEDEFRNETFTEETEALKKLPIGSSGSQKVEKKVRKMKIDQKLKIPEIFEEEAGTRVPRLFSPINFLRNPKGLFEKYQILDPSESPDDLIMSYKFLKREDHLIGVDYTESEEKELEEKLEEILEEYNSDENHRLNPLHLVFTSNIIKHIARVSRILAMKSNGNIVLMSSSKLTGRKEVVRLVAFANKMELIESSDELSTSSQGLRDELRTLIKKATLEAGIERKKVILMLDAKFSKNEKCLNDISSLAHHGYGPELYTPEELGIISCIIKRRTKNIFASDKNCRKVKVEEKVDEKFEQFTKFFKNIKLNVRIVLLMDFPVWKDENELSVVKEADNKYRNFSKNKEALELSKILQSCPRILTRFCSFDFYFEKEHSDWRKMAEKFLMKKINSKNVSNNHNQLTLKEKNQLKKKLHNLSNVIGYMHMDAMKRIQMCVTNCQHLIKTSTFYEMLEMGICISNRIRRNVDEVTRKYEDINRRVRTFKKDYISSLQKRDLLIPKRIQAQKLEEEWQKSVEVEREEFKAFELQCELEEIKVEKLQKLLVQYRRDSVRAMTEVKPMFDAAIYALRCLKYNDLLEIKRYKIPPAGTVLLAECICHMFNARPVCWQTGHALILRDNFFTELEFFNKDKITNDVYDTIQFYCIRPDFKPEVVSQGSRAAGELCRWVHAIYQYTKSKRFLEPKLVNIRRVENELKASQKLLGEKSVRLSYVKHSLNSKTQAHTQAKFATVSLKEELETLESNIEKMEKLKTRMENFTDRWSRISANETENYSSSFGDGFLTAACSIYHGYMTDEQRKHSLKLWITACHNGKIDPDTNSFTIATTAESDSLLVENDVYLDTVASEIQLSFIGAIHEKLPMSTKPDENVFVKVRKNFTICDILSEANEQRRWMLYKETRDFKSRFDALRISACALYQQNLCPFVFDPDNRFELWMKNIFQKIRNDEDFPKLNMKVNFDSYKSSSQEVDDKPQSKRRKSHNDLTSYDSLFVASLDKKAVIFHLSEDLVETTHVQLTRTASLDYIPKFSNSQVWTQKNKKRSSPKQMTKPCGPLKSLWIFEANHPDINYILLSAKEHGACLLIKYAEKNIPAVQKAIKSASQNKSHSVGGTSYITHPRFRLFISTSYDLSSIAFAGSGQLDLPFHLTSITDFSLSLDALEQRLEIEFLALQLPDFGSKQRLLEGDIVHLLNESESLKSGLLERISKSKGSFLDDEGLLEEIEKCTNEINDFKQRLSETRQLGLSLLQRRSEMIEVSHHGKMLFKGIQAASPIHPALRGITARKFINLFCDCLQNHFNCRGLKLDDATSDTAAGHLILKSYKSDLMLTLTERLVSKIQWMVGSTDALVCTSFIILFMQLESGKLSDQCMRDLLTEVEGKETGEDASLVFERRYHKTLIKPNWMSDDTWDRIINLESLRGVYSGITQSLATKPQEWKEFFDVETVMLCSMPFELLREAFDRSQKALLWKVVCPKTFKQVMVDYSMSVLGYTSEYTFEEQMKEVLSVLESHIPCVLKANTTLGYDCYVASVQLSIIAEKIGVTFVEKTAPFDEDIVKTVKDCAANGYWLYLSNCELAQNWCGELLEVIGNIVTVDLDASKETIKAKRNKYDSKEIKMKDSSTTTSHLFATDTDVEKKITNRFVKSSFVCNRNFRLWLSVREDNDHTAVSSLPIVIQRNAEYISLQISDSHQEQLKRSYLTFMHSYRKAKLNNTVRMHTNEVWNVENESEVVQRVASLLPLLHSCLLRRSSFFRSGFTSNFNWNDGDLNTVALCISTSKASTLNFLNARNFIMDLLSSSITHQHDLETFNDLALKCLPLPGEILTTDVEDNQALQLEQDSRDIILQKKKYGLSEVIYDRIVFKPGNQVFGLHQCAHQPNVERDSKNLASRCWECFERSNLKNGLQSFIGRDQSLYSNQSQNWLKETLRSLTKLVSYVGVPPETNNIKNKVMSNFFTSEVIRLKATIRIIHKDLYFILSAICSKTEMTPIISDMVKDVFSDRMLNCWLRHHNNLFCFHSSLKLTRFIKSLKTRAITMAKYIKKLPCMKQNVDTSVIKSKWKNKIFSKSPRQSEIEPLSWKTFDLSVFTRPDLFFDVLIFITARFEYGDSYKYQTQFSIESEPDTLTSLNTSLNEWEKVFLKGLHLVNAVYDPTTNTVQESKDCLPRLLPRVTVSIVRKKQSDKMSNISIESKNEISTDAYQCPVYIHDILAYSSDAEIYRQPSTEKIIFYLPLKSKTRSVSLSSLGVSVICLSKL